MEEIWGVSSNIRTKSESFGAQV